MKKIKFFLMFLFLVSCGTKENSTEEENEDDTNPEYQNGDFTQENGSKELEIYYVNDVHGYYESIDRDNPEFTLSLAKLKTVLNKAREDKNVLMLDAGDLVAGGNVFAILAKGSNMIDLYNLIGIDAMVAGNHEFDYGSARLVELKNQANFPIISANIFLKENDESLLISHIVKDFGSFKVGIFGITTPETAYKTNPKGIENLRFEEDIVKVANQEIESLKAEGVDYIIALTHLGIEGEYNSKMLATNSQGIDLIIDGHSHTEIIGDKVNDTTIVQTGSYIENIGHASVNIESKEINTEFITKEQGKYIEDDKSVIELYKELKSQNESVMNNVVAYADIEYDGLRDNVRTKETNLSKLITDAMLYYSEADIALMNGGGIRTSIDVGDITRGEIISVLPFGNLLRVIEISGQDIKDLLEHGYSALPEASGSFSQVSGVTFDFDVNQEANQRISNIKVANKDLDLEQTYKLATNDFITNGGDGYTMFTDKTVISEIDPIDVIVTKYLKEVVNSAT